MPIPKLDHKLRAFPIAIWLCSALLAGVSAIEGRPAGPQAGFRRPVGLAALTPITAWNKTAPGIWRAQAGDVAGEIRYTSLAAAPPRLETLAKRPERPFPFAAEPIAFERTADGKIMVRIPCGPGEKLYGFGLQFDRLGRSQDVLTLNVDHWSKGGGRTHAPVPFYISSRGYGVFIDTARFLKVYARVGNRKDSPRNPPPVDRNPPAGEPAPPWDAQPKSDAVEILVDGPGAELVILAGESPADVVARYNLLCGGGALPPLWGLGFWHRVHAAADADRVRKEVAEFASRGIPLDVIGLEPGWMTKSYPCTFEWQRKRFPDPAGFAAGLLRKGIRLNLWENPYVSPESRLYKTLFPLSGSHLVWLGLVPDYTLPEARRALLEQHNRDHLDIGVGGYKIDEVDGYDVWLWPDHASFPSGTPAPVMRQSYGLMMQDLIFNGLFKARNLRTYGLVRATNGAASGYPFAIYSDAYDLKEYITGVSAAGLAGVLWTPEIREAGDERDWLDRMQLVCFSALAQLNAWSSGTTPWHFPAATDRVRETIGLRMRLLPYLYSAFAAYHFEGVPPLRPMLLEDPALDRVEDQFMFGPSMLVAPFYDKTGWAREIALPAGNWYDFRTGAFAGSGGKVKAVSPQGEIPLYVREGSLVPMLKEPVANTDKAYGQPLEVRFYGRNGGTFDLYEDDGKTFDYEKGKYRIRRLIVSKGANGAFVLTEFVPKNGAPPMFGKAELRVMTGR
jgi:alpha-glucosidase (family GH31 glycosyl hydrolase)